MVKHLQLLWPSMIICTCFQFFWTFKRNGRIVINLNWVFVLRPALSSFIAMNSRWLLSSLKTLHIYQISFSFFPKEIWLSGSTQFANKGNFEIKDLTCFVAKLLNSRELTSFSQNSSKILSTMIVTFLNINIQECHKNANFS